MKSELNKEEDQSILTILEYNLPLYVVGGCVLCMCEYMWLAKLFPKDERHKHIKVSI